MNGDSKNESSDFCDYEDESVEEEPIEEEISDEEIPDDLGVKISDWASFGDSVDVSKLTKETVDRSGVTHRSYVTSATRFKAGRYVLDTMNWSQWFYVGKTSHKIAEDQVCALVHHEDYNLKELIKARSDDIRVQYKRRYSWHENRNWGFCKRRGTFFINPDYNDEVVTAKSRRTGIKDVFLLKSKCGSNMGFRIDTTTDTYIQGDWIGGLLIFRKDGPCIGLSVNGLFSEVDDDLKRVPDHWTIS